ncbi:MAG: DUF2071 domain-containing protein [Chitinophagaceae bacterium]
MFNLRTHPFAVDAFFDHSLVLTYALPVAALQPMIPDCLTLDSWNEKWGFVAAAFVSTRRLRPSGFPAWMGRDFILSGYRIFVRYTDTRGRRLRGLYIIRSVTNKRIMSFSGNLFTHYQYKTADLKMSSSTDRILVSSEKENIHIEADCSNEAILPAGSVFDTWQQARRFAGPLPFTFSADEKKNRVVIIEGVRESWTPQPVNIVQEQAGWLQQKAFAEKKLASAFLVSAIPYHWKKGRTESLAIAKNVSA